jgi:hypothetical protein
VKSLSLAFVDFVSTVLTSDHTRFHLVADRIVDDSTDWSNTLLRARATTPVPTTAQSQLQRFTTTWSIHYYERGYHARSHYYYYYHGCNQHYYGR